MGLLGGGNKKTLTTVNTTTTSTARDIGFTGAAGVDLATNLAVVGGTVAQDSLTVSRDVSGNLTDATREFFQSAFDATAENNLIASNNLDKIIQGQNQGYNRLLGGASELVGVAGELIDDTATIAQGQVASGENAFRTLVQTSSDVFDKIVGAARSVAEDLTTGSTAFVEGATATVERLGPQTKQNQNIAFAGIAVAGVVVVALLIRKR